MRIDRGRSRCQRTSCLRSATLATIEPAIWFCAQHWASAAESRFVTVESAGRLFVPGGAVRGAVPPGRRGPRRESPGSHGSVQECGTVEVAEGLEAAAIRGLALGDRHQQIVAQDLPKRSVLPPRLVFAPLGEPACHLQAAAAERCRPGSRRQRSSAARRATDSMKSSNSASAQSVRPSWASRSVKWSARSSKWRTSSSA